MPVPNVRGHHLTPLLAALLLAGCDGGLGTEPSGASAATAAVAAPAVDVSGSWVWREEVILQLPEEFALEAFGVQPEGPVTIGRCVNTGIMELAQDGSTFSGTATQNSTCVSRGGQQFSPPAFSPVLDVREGEIRGRSLRVVFGAGDVPCLYHAQIADIEDGTAVRLRGAGRCIPPGHPQSPLSALGIDLPSGPISPTVVWEATRP